MGITSFQKFFFFFLLHFHFLFLFFPSFSITKISFCFLFFIFIFFLFFYVKKFPKKFFLFFLFHFHFLFIFLPKKIPKISNLKLDFFPQKKSFFKIFQNTANFFHVNFISKKKKSENIF